MKQINLKNTMQLSRGMSPKKLHEVESLGNFTILNENSCPNQRFKFTDRDQ